MTASRGAVAKALDILRALGDASEGLRLADIAARVGLHGSTAYRTLTELAARGFVTRDGGERYYLGPAILRIASGASVYAAIRFDLRGTLTDIMRTTGFMANAQVLEPDGSRVLDAVKPPRYHSLRDFRGEVVPAHLAAGGHVLVAYAPPNIQERMLETAASQLDLAEYRRFLDALEETRARQAARLMGRLDSVIGAVSVPVFAAGRECWAALTGVGLVTDLTEDRADSLEEYLHKAARRLAESVYPGTDLGL